LIELENPLQHIYILVVEQVGVGAVLVPWIKGMEPDHVQSRERESAVVALAHLVHVFVMTPAHDHIFQTTTWLVDSILGVVTRVGVVGIVLEAVVKYVGLMEAASNGEGVTNSGPLGFTKLRKEHELAKIVDKPSQDEPVPLFSRVGPAYSLGRLEQVVDLRSISIGVRVVNNAVKELSGFPYAQLYASTQGAVLVPLSYGILIGLVGVLVAVCVLYPLCNVAIHIVTEYSLGFHSSDLFLSKINLGGQDRRYNRHDDTKLEARRSR